MKGKNVDVAFLGKCSSEFFKMESDNKALSGLAMKFFQTLMYYTPLLVFCFPDKFWLFMGELLLMLRWKTVLLFSL